MSKPIRVLHVIGSMNCGGAETMIMNLYRTIDKETIQFDFVENCERPSAYDQEITALGGRIYRCPHYNGKNHFSYTRWWRKFFRLHPGEYSIVHGHLGSTAAIYLSIAKKNGLYPIAHSHSAGKGSIGYRLYSYPTRFVANYFFACSEDSGVARFGHSVGTNPNCCKVLPNAIDTNRFMYDANRRNQIRKQLGIKDQTIVVGHVGRFTVVKNHTFILDIFSEFHKLHRDSLLLLVGNGELKPQIEKRIQQLGLQESVILTGVKPNVSDYDQAMDLYLMPSLYEGLPVSLVEAQTAGLPCFASDTIPKESALTSLVHFIPLTASPAEWAATMSKAVSYNRLNMQQTIQEKGYDIQKTAKWLQVFYENVVNHHGQQY